MVEKEYTEYVEKKVRKHTRETPMPVGDWRNSAQYMQKVVNTQQMHHNFNRDESP